MRSEEALWTIEELVERANRALQHEGLSTPDRRVREQTSPRQVRLYTTAGLISRPVLRGRTGFYGAKHLMQLVAIKRLQMRGWPLVGIQNRLLALDDEELSQIAQVPPEVLSDAPSAEQPRVGSRRRDAAFWRQTPSPTRVAELTVEQWQVIPLGDGAKLLLATPMELNADNLQALQRAAEPLRQFISQKYAHAPRGEPQLEGGNDND